jgi:hypothetical protein
VNKGEKTGEKEGTNESAGNKEQGEKKEPTVEDVKKALEKARSQDPKTQEDAAKDLVEQAHKAKDERVRQAAEDALKELGREKQDPARAKGKKKTGQENPMNPMDPKKEEGKAKSGGQKESEKGKEKQGQKGKAQGEAKPNKGDTKEPPNGTAKDIRPGAGTGVDPAHHDPDAADAKSAQQAGALQLEKDFWDKLAKMTPEEREKVFNKAKLTEQEKNQINDELGAKTSKKKTAKGPKTPKKGSLKSTGPKEVKSGDGNGAILSGKGVAPSGFAPILEKFSRDLRSGDAPKK